MSSTPQQSKYFFWFSRIENWKILSYKTGKSSNLPTETFHPASKSESHRLHLRKNRTVKMSRKAKIDFSSIETRSTDDDKKFLKMVKLMLSNSYRMGEKIILIEEGMIIPDDTLIAEYLNLHFINSKDSQSWILFLNKYL